MQNKWGVKSLAVIGGLAVVFVLIGLINEYNADPEILMEGPGKGLQQVISFELPDTLSFAGERVPLENFDTRESLDRELNSNAYFHSSTLLLMKRSHRYFPVIEPILKEYGIPDDFKYLSVAESNLTNAVSPVGATGFWQFMASTAKEYGLVINKEIDERYHLEKSTVAACRYFLKSYEKYGNWTMVAASYNRGSNGVDRQIEIQGQDNYYDLLLPEETSRYLFRILAFKTIFSQPENYGFVIPQEHLYPPLEYITVTIDTTVNSFAAFATVFGTNYKILKALNPWLRQPFLNNSPGKSYDIKVPVAGARTKVYE
ncbi:MAG: lytic transglycosylase domain-containing protein [Bacteroidales bacterium]|nr:lytic transglycosylase domain-containing protein [Bacteroidales bacterium]